MRASSELRVRMRIDARMTGRLIGIVAAGALIGYGLVPFFSGGFVLVIAGLVLGAVFGIGVRRRDVALSLLLGVVAGLAGTFAFLRAFFRP